MSDRNKPFLESHGPEGGLPPVPAPPPPTGDAEISNRPEAVAAPARRSEAAVEEAIDAPGSEYSIVYALMFLGVALLCVALPALVIGIVAISQRGGLHGGMIPYYPEVTPAPAATPSPGAVIATTPAPSEGEDHANGDHGASSDTAHDPTHYEYEGEYGPAFWGSLNSDWVMCRAGKYQSPINIVEAETLPAPADVTPLTMEHFQDVGTYVPDNEFKNQAFVSYNGHAVTTNSPLASYFLHSKRWYQLLQFHFHTPSEHTIEGEAAAAEMHMVHRSLGGSLAVIGIMIEEGPATPNFIQSLFAALPKVAEGPAQFQLSITDLLTDIGVPAVPTSFYTYSGSLTTPPCSENVLWIVLKQKVQMRTEDIAALNAIMGENARPVQERNGRSVFLAS